MHEDFACTARDLATWSRPAARSAAARRVQAPGKDGFPVRKLMSPLVLAGEAQRAHLSRLQRSVPAPGFRPGVRAGELGLVR